MAFIKHYDDCRLLWKSCRFPNKGKPLNVAGMRMLKEADNFVFVRWNRQRMATVTPDNIFVVHLMPEGSHQWAFWRLFNIYTQRITTGRYRMGWSNTNKVDNKLPEWFEGIRFNMFTHQCVNEENRPAPRVRVKDAVKEADWQRKLRRYARGWKVRAKIGALVNAVDTHMKVALEHRQPLSAEQLIELVEQEDYDIATALLARECLGWYDSKHVAERGWEAGIAHVMRHSWGRNEKAFDLPSMFERVYRRYRSSVYGKLGIAALVPA